MISYFLFVKIIRVFVEGNGCYFKDYKNILCL